jgi:hypothetical protein
MKLLKNFALALVPMIALACNVRADDSSLADQTASLDVAQIADASIDIDSFDLDAVNVDELASKADGKDSDAIEACFRRMDYCQSYYPSYSYCYYPSYSYYTPSYSYYRPYYSYSPYCYAPVVHTQVVYSPVVTQYWGCH